MSRNIVRQPVTEAGGSDNVLMRVSTAVAVAGPAPYKYKASVYRAQYKPDGTAGDVLLTDIDLWLSEKASMDTEEDRWYFGQKRGTHWEGIKKKR